MLVWPTVTDYTSKRSWTFRSISRVALRQLSKIFISSWLYVLKIVVFKWAQKTYLKILWATLLVLFGRSMYHKRFHSIPQNSKCIVRTCSILLNWIHCHNVQKSVNAGSTESLYNCQSISSVRRKGSTIQPL